MRIITIWTILTGIIFFQLMNNCTHFVYTLVGRGNVYFYHIHTRVPAHFYPVFRWVMIGLRNALRLTGLALRYFRLAIANIIWHWRRARKDNAFIFYHTHTNKSATRITRKKTRMNNALNNVIYWIT